MSLCNEAVRKNDEGGHYQPSYHIVCLECEGCAPILLCGSAPLKYQGAHMFTILFEPQKIILSETVTGEKRVFKGTNFKCFI